MVALSRPRADDAPVVDVSADLVDDGDLHATANANKRQKTTAYLPGSIVRVEVKNFMTYSHCVIEPGPTLNLVLGPNGTGKSSFVCALCVGLAGSTRLLGRADDVGSYIRRGKNSGQVEVTLAKEGRAIGGSNSPNQNRTVVRRLLKRDHEGKVSSDFWIDGKKATMAAVKELVGKYNIQLDNLCQFLPQDKVAEFARMKPTELLRATEMAIGDGELWGLHESVVEEKKALDAKEKVLEMHETVVGRQKEELKELEKVLGPIREKQRLKREMETLEALKLWRTHEELVSELKIEEETMNKAQNTLERLRKEQLSLKNGPVKKKSEAKARAEKAAKAAAKEVKAYNMEPLTTEIENNVLSANRKVDAVNTLEERSKKHRSQVAAAEHDINNLKEQIRALEAGPTDEGRIKADIRTIDCQLKDLQAEELGFSSARHELDDKHMHLMRVQKLLYEQQRRIGERQNQALTALDQHQHGTERVYHLIRQNKSRFRGQVLGPLATEMEVHKGHYARVLEHHLPRNWLFYYVVEYQEDMEQVRAMMQQCGVTPRIVLVEGDRYVLRRETGRIEGYGKVSLSSTHSINCSS